MNRYRHCGNSRGRTSAAAILAFCICAAGAGFSSSAGAQAVSEQEAQAIAVDAYVYFYPLVSFEVTRRQFTNVEPGKIPGRGPMNAFSNVPSYPPGDDRGVVRVNFDTLYSSAFLDLTKGPLVVSVPDTGGRYYLLPMLDMWTDVFASPGWRTTGTQAGNFLVAPPGWRGATPDGFARIDAPTPIVWIIGRTKTDGPSDYDAVHKIQAGYRITPLSDWGKSPRTPEVKLDPSIDMKTPPKVQVDTMPAAKYFAYAADALKQAGPHLTDQPIIARMKRIGIEAGLRYRESRSDHQTSPRSRACERPGAHEMENADLGSRSERLVDEHRHDGSLR